MAEPRIMALRRADGCATCGAALDAGTRAEWNPSSKIVTCLVCVEKREPVESTGRPIAPTPVELDRGIPGASAKRKYDNLHQKREQHARQKLGRRLGGVYLALSNEPQSTLAWGVGSKGERVLGGYLESLHDEQRVIVLHDRRIPGSRANIDHVAICRGGVHVIDAKRYSGKVQRIDRGGWFSTDVRLYVGRRDCTKLLAGATKQVEVVRSALEGLLEGQHVGVYPSLCFVDAEWSFFAKPFALNGVWVGWPKALGERLLAPGHLTQVELTKLARHVAQALPPA